MKCFCVLRRLRRAQKAKSDNGFSLVEVMVSILIIMLAAVALAGVLTQTVTAVSFSRQSQQASNLAAAALAEVESMPWTTGTGLANSGDANYGLPSTDVASDSNLTPLLRTQVFSALRLGLGRYWTRKRGLGVSPVPAAGEAAGGCRARRTPANKERGL
jgi:type II secretory pathway pseudopilin PulG